MASTPAPFSSRLRARVAGLAVVVGVGALSGCDPLVSITLSRADDLNPDLPVPFVRFAFRVAGEPVDEPRIAGPFSIATVPDGDFVEVPPGQVFSVDVQGCNALADAECQSENKFVARGCEGGFTRARDEGLAITIALHPADVGNALCPVEDPDVDAFVPPPAEGEGEG